MIWIMQLFVNCFSNGRRTNFILGFFLGIFLLGLWSTLSRIYSTILWVDTWSYITLIWGCTPITQTLMNSWRHDVKEGGNMSKKILTSRAAHNSLYKDFSANIDTFCYFFIYFVLVFQLHITSVYLQIHQTASSLAALSGASHSGKKGFITYWLKVSATMAWEQGLTIMHSIQRRMKATNGPKVSIM